MILKASNKKRKLNNEEIYETIALFNKIKPQHRQFSSKLQVIPNNL